MPNNIASGPKQVVMNTAIPYPIPNAIALTTKSECTPKKNSLHLVSKITSTISVNMVVNPESIVL